MNHKFFDGSPLFSKTYHFDTFVKDAKRPAKIPFFLRCRRTFLACRSHPFSPILQILRSATLSGSPVIGLARLKPRTTKKPISNEFSNVTVESI